MQRILLFFLISCFALPLLSQPFLPTRAAMYNQGPDPYQRQTGVGQVEIWRYVPGARFESGWDIKIEDRSYDQAGNMLSWNRYQSVSGTPVWGKAYTYFAGGERRTEKTVRSIEGSETLIRYKMATGEEEGEVVQNLLDENDNFVGKMIYSPKGVITYIENPDNLPKARIFAYDLSGKSLELADAGAQKRVQYTYDEKGELKSITQVTPAGTTVTKYQNTYDENGRLVRQEEQFEKNSLVRKFVYDDQDRLIQKTDAEGFPLEYRSYYPNGKVASILISGPDGHPLEVLRYVYK